MSGRSWFRRTGDAVPPRRAVPARRVVENSRCEVSPPGDRRSPSEWSHRARDGRPGLAGVDSAGRLCVAGVLVLGAVLSSAANLPPVTAPRVLPVLHRVDLNRADVAELALLPELGPALAARIAADRAVRGRFGSIDDLGRVRGIGPARLASLRSCAWTGTEPRGGGASASQPSHGTGRP